MGFRLLGPASGCGRLCLSQGHSWSMPTLSACREIHARFLGALKPTHTPVKDPPVAKSHATRATLREQHVPKDKATYELRTQP